MRHQLLSSFTMAPASTATISTIAHHHKKSIHHLSNPNPSSPISTTTFHCSAFPCKNSPLATLDILIFILVLFSGAFLVSSYLFYLFHTLSLLLPPLSHPATHCFILAFLFFFLLTLVFLEMNSRYRSRKCERPNCKGLKMAMEFDLQLQTEDCLRSPASAAAVREVDELPWKGGSEGNPDYECLRAELRKIAPPNGRVVLMFFARCGCPVAKLVGWGPKRGRRHKKGQALNGGDSR
ncbi:uncharacterized protein At5g19025-like [Diospyros lotus]|uniref:uncharacterized protein At5g19025-like n=1 Tax=Diospyros lotus TaxID=55363 RepID=UPI002255C1BD|nr:uncharacterized protein At5g19025-like [Diospyros lotus]